MRATIHTPTPDLAASTDFYERLGFERLPPSEAGTSVESGSPPKPVHLADSQVVIEINPDRFARAGVRLTKPSWDEELAALAAIATVSKLDSHNHMVMDPSGVWVYLTQGVGEGPPLPDHASVLGGFAGLSLETGSIPASAAFWEVLGFQVERKQTGSVPSAEDLAAKDWLSSKNETGLIVTWMRPNRCPHLFFNPSLTYFNSGRNPEVIAAIRAAGVPIAEEITVFNESGEVDNVILRDPGGYGFFVFND